MIYEIDDCVSFCEYGMKSNVLIPKVIFDDFSLLMNNVMVLLTMSDYSYVYSRSQDKFFHYFKFMKNQTRTFTISLYSNIDEYNSMVEVSISYHYHNDYSVHQNYKKIFDDLFAGVGKIDDNMIILETEEDVIDGLKIFQKII